MEKYFVKPHKTREYIFEIRVGNSVYNNMPEDILVNMINNAIRNHNGTLDLRNCSADILRLESFNEEETEIVKITHHNNYVSYTYYRVSYDYTLEKVK